jgi:hypothetical protein
MNAYLQLPCMAIVNALVLENVVEQQDDFTRMLLNISASIAAAVLPLSKA